MYPFRVFVSYAHADRPLAQRVVDALDDARLEPVWDRDIRPGTAFTDEIRSKIAGVHIFLPLITPRSQERPWVHQETGYAIGLGVPVLPLAIGDLPGEMIAQLQALPVPPDLAGLANVLSKLDLEAIVLGQSRRVEPAITVADHPEQRTETAARLANRALDAGKYGTVRQRSRLAVFTVPDLPIDDTIWDARDGHHRRTPFLRGWMREERRSFERHARVAGCRLLIHPMSGQFNTEGPYARWARLTVLRDFLASMPDDKVRVVLTHRSPDGNTILVGDWFLMESLVPRAGQGYLQTVFNTHAPTVFARLRRFDQEFDEQYAASGLGPNESRRAALEAIESVLATLEAPPR